MFVKLYLRHELNVPNKELDRHPLGEERAVFLKCFQKGRTDCLYFLSFKKTLRLYLVYGVVVQYEVMSIHYTAAVYIYVPSL